MVPSSLPSITGSSTRIEVWATAALWAEDSRAAYISSSYKQQFNLTLGLEAAISSLSAILLPGSCSGAYWFNTNGYLTVNLWSQGPVSIKRPPRW